jgi:D-cysteine desulfhydrase
MNLAKIPRRGYVQDPTPIEFLPHFSRALGGQVEVYVKRDDLLPGCAGGNKTRKLDFCIADALAKKADTLITCGAVQSNHARLTLAWAVKEGLECHLVLEERVKGSYKPEASGNNFLYQLLGVAGITVVPGGAPMQEEMEKAADSLRAQGKNPYIIPGGASNALGALGYAACAQEIMEQLFRMRLDIHTLVVPSGSAGTHAGVVVGLHGSEAGIPVLGINVSRPRKEQEELVYKLVRETAALAGVSRDIPASAVNCNGDYVGAGYSLPTDSMIEAVKLLARTEAILLDPVYTGKAMAGFIDQVRNGAFPRGSSLLFLHTGGAPALYAYTDTFRSSLHPQA